MAELIVDALTTTSELIRLFHETRAATERVASWLSDEDQVLQAMPDASPTKWHRAHTTWFFETFLLVPNGVPVVDETYAFLFNSYYESLGPRHARPHRGMLSRPSARDVTTYRRIVDERMTALLETATEDALSTLAPLVQLGVAHEEQHQELMLTDIVAAFALHPHLPRVRAASDVDAQIPQQSLSRDDSSSSFVDFAGGLVSHGGDQGASFSFDNESPAHQHFIAPFALSTSPVSVGAMKAFIRDGGYSDARLWLSDGFSFVREHDLVAPLYARIDGDAYIVFGVDGERRADDNEPVTNLSYYEADALARFLDARLPTEHEWEHAAEHVDVVGNSRDNWALRPLPRGASSTTNDKRGNTSPLSQMYFDVWEWTQSAYDAYPGFRAARGAVGEYNGKFMINQMVLRGGSCFTPHHHMRKTVRNFWPPSTRFQMSGLRLARDP